MLFRSQAGNRGSRRPDPVRNIDHFGGTDVDVRASKGPKAHAHTVVCGVGPPHGTAATPAVRPAWTYRQAGVSARPTTKEFGTT